MATYTRSGKATTPVRIIFPGIGGQKKSRHGAVTYLGFSIGKKKVIKSTTFDLGR